MQLVPRVYISVLVMVETVVEMDGLSVVNRELSESVSESKRLLGLSFQ